MLQRVTIVTPAAGEPVTVAQIKSQIEMDAGDTSKDAALAIIGQAARAACEEATGLLFMTQTLKLSMDHVPGGREPWWDGVRDGAEQVLAGKRPSFIELPYGPLRSVASVTTYDDSDTPTVMAAGGYYVDLADKRRKGRVVLRLGSVWPVALRTANSVEVVYDVGFGNAGNLPAPLQLAILMVADHLFNTRGSGQGGEQNMPVSALAICNRYKLRNL